MATLTLPRLTAVTLGIALLGGPALALSAGCSALPYSSGGTLGFGADETWIYVHTAFDEGEVVTYTATVTDISGTGTGSFRFTDSTQDLTAPESPSGLITRTITIPSGGADSLRLTATDYQFANAQITCAAPAPPAAAPDLTKAVAPAAVLASLAGQAGAVAEGVSASVRGRFDGGPAASVTRNGVAFSSQTDDGGFGLWGTLSFRGYSADSEAGDGRSADLVFGIDRALTDRLLAGAFVAHGRGRFGPEADETDVTATVGGVYGAVRFGPALTLDGYLGGGTARYDLDGADIDADRRIAGLSLSGTREFRAGILTPTLALRAARDDLPRTETDSASFAAQRIETVTASLGARFDWAGVLPGTGLHPWLSVGLDHGRVDPGRGDRSDFTAPRLGLGLAGRVGPGTLSVDLDAGKVASDVRDAGLALSYRLAF